MVDRFERDKFSFKEIIPSALHLCPFFEDNFYHTVPGRHVVQATYSFLSKGCFGTPVPSRVFIDEFMQDSKVYS